MKYLAMIAAMGFASASFAQQADFSGFYEGVQIGRNQSQALGLQPMDRTSTYPGLIAGYSQVTGGNLLGVEAFADYHSKSTTGKDAGLGVRVGKVMGQFLVYGRVAVTGIKPSYRPQLGLGAEYKLDKHWALTAFVAQDKTTDGGIKRQNKNMTMGLNYYFH